MSLINIETTTWFDRFPTEIIFQIFNYLSSNDIIYTFFFFNQRLNYLLLQNEEFLNHLDLPTTDFDFWKDFLSVIGSRIETLNIKTIDLSFPLTYFPNLKSLIISPHYGLPVEQIKSIFEWDHFQNLISFKHKGNKFFSNQFNDDNPTDQKHLLKELLNQQSSLEVCQYSLEISFTTKLRKSFQINSNLRSLTLILQYFTDAFVLISYTPNLEYLNIQINSIYRYWNTTSIDKTNIKLKQFYLTLIHPQIHCDGLIDDIKQFSSTLTCLSLNLLRLSVRNVDHFPLNSQKLQQLLESMIELKQFHLYAKHDKDSTINQNILSQFQNEYWFDHKWLFGMHGRYIYTLPFHFDHLHQFYQGFNDVKCSYPEILITNLRIWYNVKSIDLLMTYKYDFHFLQELKMKMPKLTAILFSDIDYMLNEKEENRENSLITLNNVTTIRCPQGRLEDEKDWIINSLPNLKHLILYQTKLSSKDNQLTKVLNKNIQILDINPDYELEQFINIDYVHFSNVEHIYFNVDITFIRPASYPNIIIKILNNFKKLKTLTIYSRQAFVYDLKTIKTEVVRLIQNLGINIYEIKHFQNYLLFTKNNS